MPWHRGPRIHRTSGEIQTPVRGDGNRRSLQTQETAFRDRTARCPPAGPVVVDHQARQRACRGEIEAFSARTRPLPLTGGQHSGSANQPERECYPAG